MKIRYQSIINYPMRKLRQMVLREYPEKWGEFLHKLSSLHRDGSPDRVTEEIIEWLESEENK
ncbi:hypothetical protein ACFLZ4_00620 [Patescibacteria group bacterium]